MKIGAMQIQMHLYWKAMSNQFCDTSKTTEFDRILSLGDTCYEDINYLVRALGNIAINVNNRLIMLRIDLIVLMRHKMHRSHDRVDYLKAHQQYFDESRIL